MSKKNRSIKPDEMPNIAPIVFPATTGNCVAVAIFARHEMSSQARIIAVINTCSRLSASVAA